MSNEDKLSEEEKVGINTDAMHWSVLAKQLTDRFTPLEDKESYNSRSPDLKVLIGKTIKYVYNTDTEILLITDDNEYLGLHIVEHCGCDSEPEFEINNDGVTVEDFHKAGAISDEDMAPIVAAHQREVDERERRWDMTQLKALQEKYPNVKT